MAQKSLSCDCERRSFIPDDGIDEKLRRLVRTGDRPDSWNENYTCPACGSLWEMSYPEAGGQCCGIEAGVERVLLRVGRGPA